MKFKTPKFWYPEPSTPQHPAAIALTPVAWLYNQASKAKQFLQTTRKAPCPVICIGNLNAGGSGKTPTAIALVTLIRDHNLFRTPFFLTRGYGGNLKGPLKVDPKIHSYTHVGDEALLLAKHSATIMGPRRGAGAHMATKNRADLIIMDDGLQNNSLHQNLKIAVIDGTMGVGNGKTIPAGPLREDLKTGLQKPDLFIIIGEDKAGTTDIIPPNKPIIHAQITANTKPFQDKKYVAFCGLGYPQKFYNTLRDANINLINTIDFPDHYPYTSDDLQFMLTKAERANARLITTEKDLMRIPSHFHDQIDTLPITLTFGNPAPLIEKIKALSL